MLTFGWLLDQVRETKKQIKALHLKTIAKNGLLVLIIILSLLAIYFAQSEGALAALLAAFLLIGLLSRPKIAWATVGLIVILAAVVIGLTPLRDYAVKKITMNDLSGQIRKLQWKETFVMMRTQKNIMLFGTGLAGYQQAIVPYHQAGFFYNFDNDPDFKQQTIESTAYRTTHWQPVEVYLYPHNILLNFWIELGLVGMLLFVWILVKCFVLVGKLIWRSNKKIYATSEKNTDKYFVLGLGGAVLTMIIHGWVDVPYFKNDLAVLFWMVLLLIGLLSKRGFKKAV
jgi:O-antigen ligase